MPTRFTTFQDAVLDIGVANVPFSTSNVDTNKKAYLSFCVIPTLDVGQTVDLEVQLNAQFLLQEQFTTEGMRVIQLNVDAGILDPVNQNTLTLIKAAGLGAVAVSNCVVHWKS
jgi:hypothetical protein